MDAFQDDAGYRQPTDPIGKRFSLTQADVSIVRPSACRRVDAQNSAPESFDGAHSTSVN